MNAFPSDDARAMNQPTLAMLEQASAAGDERARLALADRLFREHRFDSPEHARGISLLQDAAKGPRSGEACWMLGAYYLQVTTWPDAHRHAAHWLGRASDAGIAPAMDRLANLHLRGLGVPQDAARAIALQQMLADGGFQQAAWEVGYLLSQQPSHDAAAATAFARACALGYPSAYYALGLRFALGAGVARDAPLGRALLLRAADAGFPDARDAADELVPASEAGDAAARWHAALKDNLVAARQVLAQLMPADRPPGAPVHPLVPRLEAHFAALGHPALRIDAGGRLAVGGDGSASLRAQPRVDWLAQQPRVARVSDFATREEAASLMHRVAATLARPDAYKRRLGGNDAGELASFSGRGAVIDALHADAVVRLLESRIAGLTDWPVDALEPCSIVRYAPGEEYRPHADFITDDDIAANASERGDLGGQRVATFLVCLRAPESGGETRYLEPGLVVAAARGAGILHYNVTADGRPDASSTHAGLPVGGGEKWLWRSTLRAHSLYASA